MRVLEGSEGAGRALARLQGQGAELVREGGGTSFALLPRGDRRRRPVLRLSAGLVSMLAAEGALEETGGRYRLSAAGRARAVRGGAEEDEAFRAQHDPIVPRAVMDGDGDLRAARGIEPGAPLAKLAKLTDANRRPFFSARELDAAYRLRADWEAGQMGLVRGSDWSAPPRGSAARTGGNGVEAARAGGLDARRRVEQAFAALAPMLAAAVRGACLDEQAISALEQSQRWPARSGKLALKLGLAQLAEHYRLH